MKQRKKEKETEEEKGGVVGTRKISFEWTNSFIFHLECDTVDVQSTRPNQLNKQWTMKKLLIKPLNESDKTLNFYQNVKYS